jgi:predicted metalloprotease with PDZ domain
MRERHSLIPTLAAACVLSLLPSLAATSREQRPLQPIQYTFRVFDAANHLAEIEATIPTDGRASIDLMMPIWTPGYYVVEDYASRVRDLSARSAQGAALEVSKPAPNRWQVQAGGAPVVRLSYRLLCQGRSVTSNWVDADLGVINGGAAFITIAERARRPHDVRIEMPATWKQSATGLDAAPDGGPHHYRAADFDVLADSPIVAGDLDVREFVVDGSRHVLVDAGQRGEWNGSRAASDIETMVKETRKFWGSLPFKRYVFLNVFRQGGGGLEHANSTLLTSSPKSTTPTKGWLSFVAHEYFHAFNVKRLRPVELGPFDYENPPRTTSLWLSEGGTTYYGNLMLVRAGLTTPQEFLDGMSSAIAALQRSPGRLTQSLAQSSAEVWTNSNSGVGAKPTTVSYYGKGNVVSFLLDAHIRRTTNGKRSLDDVMRIAYERYGGARGFTQDELRATVEEVMGRGVKAWFAKAIESPGELDYGEMLAWYGLRFAGGEDARESNTWVLEVRPRATAAQRRQLAALVKSAGPVPRPRPNRGPGPLDLHVDAMEGAWRALRSDLQRVHLPQIVNQPSERRVGGR